MFRFFNRQRLPPRPDWHPESCETGTGYYAHADDLLLTITPELAPRGGYRLIVLAPDGAWLTDRVCGMTPGVAQRAAEVWLETYRASRPAADGPHPGV